MATEAVDEAEEGAADGKVTPARGKKKLVLIVAAAAVVLAGGGGGAYMFLGGHKDGKPEVAIKSATSGEPHGEGKPENFVDVPPMVVNLRSADGASRYLKLHFELVATAGVKPEEMKKSLPLVIDAIQPFLRELRPEDLAGSAAVFRIKEQILIRAADVLGSDQVKDVLIEDLIQQ